jgi:hypothetical protein
MIALGGIAHQYGLITQIFRAPTPDISDEEMANQFTRILLNGVQATPICKREQQENPETCRTKQQKGE